MAKATLVNPLQRPDVQLTLSPEEADTLYAIMQSIGGNPQTSRRKHADAINKALKSVGGLSQSTSDILRNNAIYFMESI